MPGASFFPPCYQPDGKNQRSPLPLNFDEIPIKTRKTLLLVFLKIARPFRAATHACASSASLNSGAPKQHRPTIIGRPSGAGDFYWENGEKKAFKSRQLALNTQTLYIARGNLRTNEDAQRLLRPFCAAHRGAVGAYFGASRNARHGGGD